MKRLVLYFLYLRGKMLRDKMSPNRVAAGWALGMFVGCAVPFGMQLVVSVPLSIILRISKIGATLGTLVTNPVTILFIYPVQIWAGAQLLGKPLDWTSIQDYVARLAHVSLFSASGWHTLAEIGGLVLGGFFIGGILLAAICTPITYFAVKNLVVRYRAAKEARAKRKRKEA